MIRCLCFIRVGNAFLPSSPYSLMIEAAIRAPKQRTGNLDAFIEPLAVMFIIKFLTANRSSRHPL